jgi:NADH dehydrogenase
MAHGKYGKRTGVAMIFEFKVHGFVAWILLRTYNLIRLPTLKKKIRVIADWTIDLIYQQDISAIKINTFEEENKKREKK